MCPVARGGGVCLVARGGGVCPVARGGGVCLVARGGGVCLVARGGGVCPVARGGGVCLVARGGGVCPVAVRFAFSILNADIHRSLNQPCNSDFALYCNLLADALAIISAFIRDIVQIHITVAAFSGLIVIQAVKRILTGVEPHFAQLGSILRVCFANLVLETTAFQFFVKSLKHFHFGYPP